MSENEPLINFNCPCGKPVAAPASLAGQKLHCPYAGCETIITAPAADPAADPAPAADPIAAAAESPSGKPADGKPADGKPKQPRMPPPKGMKSGKGLAPAAPRKKPAPPSSAAADKPAATEAPATPAAETPAPAPKKKNALFFAACSAVTAGVVFFMMNNRDKPAPKVVTVVQPAPAKAPAPAQEAPPPPSTPAPPLENGARKPRQQMTDAEMEALNARLAGGIQEQKKVQDEEFQKLVAAAAGGGLEAIFDLADAHAQGKGTPADLDKARELLLKATEKRSSKAWYKLAELEESRSAEKAAEYFMKGALLVADSKAETRDEKLRNYAKRLRDLGAEKQAVEVEALMGKPAKHAPEAPAPATPNNAEPAAPAIPEPAVPAIPEPAAPAIPEPAAPGIPEPAAPAIPEPAAPAIPEPAAPGIPEPAAPGIPEPAAPVPPAQV